MTLITPELRALREAFRRHDREIMLVGGAVRSMLLGEPPSDIDLCTDADPDEQRAIYQAEHYKHFPTGVQHGTWTVLLADDVVEITSLRTERDHDGRHATMRWTRDWCEDLSRRDLTINAMAMSFDGEILDPFGGRTDLTERVVRFVGDPAARIREDYLRILRFFRFHAQIARTRAYNAATIAAISAEKTGLAGVARERVWAEVRRIIAGPHGIKTLYDIIDLGLAPLIDLPTFAERRLNPAAEYQETRDPISLMAVYLATKENVSAQAAAWRWSVAEHDQASFLAFLLMGFPDLTLRRAQSLVTRGVMKYWLSEGLRLLARGDDAAALLRWPVPDFPILGRDLLDYGVPQGPEVGHVLRALKDQWDQSEFSLSKPALLDLVPTVRQHESDLPSD